MKWQTKPKAPEEFIKKFPEYPPLVLQLLHDRGLTTQEQIDEFFNPDYSQDLYDPFLMLGMKEAVERILKAIEEREKIVVYADYDCDGVCGAIILEETIKKLGGTVFEVYIPDKATEGYGLNVKAIEGLKEKAVELIIAVDCGITNHAEIDFANSLKMDVIIIDHHQVVKVLPKAIVVDPYQDGDRYPFKDLAAAGVVFKLAQALLAEVRKQGKELDISEGWEKWLLDLVALATVADVVSLLGENRTLVKYGLVVLAQTKRIGLQELMKTANINPILEISSAEEAVGVNKLVSRIEAGMKQYATNLTARILGFILAPRLNAASRMEHANIAYQLLTTESLEEAEDLAGKLDGLNRERQKLVINVVKEIEEKNPDLESRKIIFAASPNWPIGIAGLVATKLTDKYHRPAFIFNIEDGKAKGSARSIPELNILEAMTKVSHVLENFGGHPCAAGCVLKANNLDQFRNLLEEYAEEKLPKDLLPTVDIDYETRTSEINWQNYDLLHKFSPFGEGNPVPLFCLRNTEIFEMRTVGNDNKHLKLVLAGDDSKTSDIKKFPAIGFNHGIRYDEFRVGDKVDVAFELLANEWNGNRELQLKIIDIKRCE